MPNAEKKSRKSLLNVDELKVTVVATDLLEPDQKPRTHTNSQIHALAKSIETFGFLMPILIDAARRIIAGHARWLAAKL